MAPRTLVLGLGNPLLGDEGVGVHAAQALVAGGCPQHVEVLDIGTAILDALPALEQAERVIVVDAVKAGELPGTLYRMPFEEFAKKPTIASMHGFDLDRTLALAGRSTRPEVVVIGVEPAYIDWSLEMSPAVAGRLPAIIELLHNEIGAA